MVGKATVGIALIGTEGLRLLDSPGLAYRLLGVDVVGIALIGTEGLRPTAVILSEEIDDAVGIALIGTEGLRQKQTTAQMKSRVKHFPSELP
jgi:hypothetical protein